MADVGDKIGSARSSMLDVESVTVVGSVITWVKEKLEHSATKFDDSHSSSFEIAGHIKFTSGKLKSLKRNIGLLGNRA